jgi:hypothetical protein
MDRALSIAQLVLPLALAGVAAVVWAKPGVPMVLSMLAAGLLGWALVLTVRSVLTMAGVVAAGSAAARRVQLLERDKLALLGAIKEIEFDAAVQRLSSDEALVLTGPLRERAKRVLKELDEARQESGATSVADAIDRELQRRLGGKQEQESAG